MTGNREKESNETMEARGEKEPNNGNVSIFRRQRSQPKANADVPSSDAPLQTVKHDDWLRRSLRQLYQDNASDPLPESFLKLLDELDRKEREGR